MRQETRRNPLLLILSMIAKVFLLAVAIPQAALGQSIQISSPANGTVVNPGRTLSVTVTSPSGTTFSQIALIGPNPIGFNVQQTSAPAQFSISIPADAACRLYNLTADGITASGQGATSVPIQIDIERPDLPVSLSTFVSDVVMESLGEQTRLVILAAFGDGSVVDVTESTLLSYTSSNSSVVGIDARGAMTAVGPGSAAVSVTYTQGGKSLQLTVPVQVLNPLLIASPSSLVFPAQPAGTSSGSQQLTLTSMATANLSIFGLSTTGDFSETDSCVASSPLTPGNSCVANVIFSPTATGSRAGSLSVANSANTVPPAISLTGTGTSTPAITGIGPTSGSVGTSVTISGVNFGAAQGASTVTFNGKAATPTSWSATSIVVPVPTGATTGNVVVTVGGVASNGVNFAVNSVTYVQGNSASQTSTNSISTYFPSQLETVGDLNIVVIACYDSTACQITSVNDTNGNTYGLAVGPTTFASGTTTLLQAIYYANVSSTANVNFVTVSFKKATGKAELRIAEYSGLGSVDVSVANAASIPFTGGSIPTPASSGSATTTNAHDLLVAADTTNVVTTGAGAHFTARIITSNSNLLEDEEVTATGTYSATAPLQPPAGTTSGTALYVMQMVVFRTAH